MTCDAHAIGRYDINILSAKIENPYDTNYRRACPAPAPSPRTNNPPPPTPSDDELMFWPYVTWAQATAFKPEQSCVANFR